MKKVMISSIVMGALLGCASEPPPKALIDARAEVTRAQQVQTAAPAEVAEAKRVLNLAEAAYNNDSRSKEAEDLGYVALRRAQAAEARALALAAERDRDLARQEREQALAQISRSGAPPPPVVAKKEPEPQPKPAEKKDLASLLEPKTKVRDEARGTVITMPGTALFDTGKSEILAPARARLDEVAEAIKATNDQRPMLIQGHTDSTGSKAINDTLSLRRADAVKQYLITRGIDMRKVRTEGLGSSQPVESNETPDGRAANRRVEIILETPVS